eukprot:COSAG01_NODE_4879_length_4656_cov_5.636384_5_plen_57_part_00
MASPVSISRNVAFMGIASLHIHKHTYVQLRQLLRLLMQIAGRITGRKGRSVWAAAH